MRVKTRAGQPAIEPLDWEPPQSGTAVEIVHGIRWIRHQVPGPLRYINVWLLPGREGQVLVDTGMKQPETVQAWERLARAERLEATLRSIIITHNHPDHFGLAGHLAARFGVPVRMSAPGRAATQRILAGGAASVPGALEQYRETWGYDFHALLERARTSATFAHLLSGMPPEMPPIAEGERLAELRDPWRASLHFGHAEGHVCLHWEAAGLLISGDQLLPTISSNVSLFPEVGETDPLSDYLDSLERLAELPDATIVLPAHGPPFRGVRARVAQLRAEHAGRLAQLLELTASPREVPELVGALFGARNLEGFNSLLAFGETLAHIRYLHRRGRLARLAQNGTVRWARA